MSLNWAHIQCTKQVVTLKVIVQVSTGLAGFAEGFECATTLLKRVAIKLAEYNMFTSNLNSKADFDTNETRTRVFITTNKDPNLLKTVLSLATQLSRNLSNGGFIEVGVLV